MSKQAEWNKCGLFFSPFESKFDRILHALPIPLCPPKGEKKQVIYKLCFLSAF